MASEATDLDVREPVTGIKFLKSLTLPGATKELQLYGAGVREKSFAFFTVKVYAVGVYLAAEISDHIASWKGRSVAAILNDASLSKILIEAPVEKGLSLILARDIRVDQFLRGFKEAITPALKANSPSCLVDKVLLDFSTIFQGQALKKYTTIYFTWIQPFSLQIAIRKEMSTALGPYSTIESAPLAKALFDMFLGVNPVSPIAKSTIVASLLEVIEIKHP